MTNDNYEPEDKDLTDEYIAWLRETSPAKHIPYECFKTLFDNEEAAHYEIDDGPITDEQIAWLREISPAKNIPDENFISLFDILCLPENEKKQSYEPDNGPLTDKQMDWIRKQTFPLKKEDCEIDDLLDELEKRLLNKA